MILLIHGEETYFSLKKIFQIKEKFLLDNKELGIISEYSETDFDINDFSNKLLPVTFFEEKKLFILNNLLSNLPKKRGDEQEENIKKLLNILDSAPESSLIVFMERNKKPNSKFSKEVERRSKKVWEFDKMQNSKITDWAKNEIRARGSQIEKNALDKLISSSNNDIWQLDQEIEKLTLYKNGGIISPDDIKNLVPPSIQTNIFNFINSIGRKNNKEALLELNKLINKGDEPVYILKMLVYQIKTMLIIKDLEASGMGKKEISQTTKKHPFVVEKTLNQLRNFTLSELIQLYDKVFELEITLKRGGQKPENALIFFAEKLC